MAAEPSRREILGSVSSIFDIFELGDFAVALRKLAEGNTGRKVCQNGVNSVMSNNCGRPGSCPDVVPGSPDTSCEVSPTFAAGSRNCLPVFQLPACEIRPLRFYFRPGLAGPLPEVDLTQIWK